ncbi:unnamed protein product [Anisakis simplex]|uniref:Secreted phosphoprotein 24 n=1 Tax=Anisakis simplex TaxID=6269 RepID=A0A0M3J7J9_ANISI|nr:unnamed protein product [Anisakis simplex]
MHHLSAKLTQTTLQCVILCTESYGNEAYGSDSDLNKKPIFAIDEMREASSDSDDDDTLNVRVMRKNACVPPHNITTRGRLLASDKYYNSQIDPQSLGHYYMDDVEVIAHTEEQQSTDETSSTHEKSQSTS